MGKDEPMVEDELEVQEIEKEDMEVQEIAKEELEIQEIVKDKPEVQEIAKDEPMVVNESEVQQEVVQDKNEAQRMVEDNSEFQMIVENEPEVQELAKEEEPEVQEIVEDKSEAIEVKVLLEDSPSTPQMVTMSVSHETTLPDIVDTVGNLLKNKNSNFIRANLLFVESSEFDYVFETISDSEDSRRSLNKLMNNSQSSTKINYLDLSDKENEIDLPNEEATNALVRAVSIESIRSSRSPSPVCYDDNNQSSGTINIENSSLLSDKGSSQRKSSQSRESNILTIYPPPPERGGISININDYECLRSNEFLNDVIIDFYLMYLMREQLSPEDKKRTHLFSSHFYTRFAKPYTNADDANFSSEDERRHAGVQRWTKNVDIFDKDFIIIPVNENSHWYLVIICFPYLVPDDDDEEFQYVSNGHSPCILIFDSLYNKKSSVIKKLQGYLSCEFYAKKGIRKSFSNSKMPLLRPQIPKQWNATDCGLFLLQYVENFFKDPILEFSDPLQSLLNWFEDEVIDEKREQIANLIQKLSVDFHKGKSIEFPKINFTKKKQPELNKSSTDIKDPDVQVSKPKTKKKKGFRLFDTDSSDEEEIPIQVENKNNSVAEKNQSFWYNREEKKSIRIEIKNNRVAEKNQSSWRNINTNFPDKERSPISFEISQKPKKTGVPCYANSRDSPVKDTLDLYSDKKTVERGSPPYCLPSKQSNLKRKALYTQLNKTVDLGVASESPVKSRVLNTPSHMQSRGQKMLSFVLNDSNKSNQPYGTNSCILKNKTEAFYQIQIDKT